jgi:hypothetical protein
VNFETLTLWACSIKCLAAAGKWPLIKGTVGNVGFSGTAGVFTT